jgi:hypothetical protein
MRSDPWQLRHAGAILNGVSQCLIGGAEAPQKDCARGNDNATSKHGPRGATAPEASPLVFLALGVFALPELVHRPLR